MKNIKKYVFSTALTINNELTTLHDIQVVTKFLRKHPNITQLYLLNNIIDYKGIKALASHLPKCLKELDLQGNNITLLGIEKIAELTLNNLRIHKYQELYDCLVKIWSENQDRSESIKKVIFYIAQNSNHGNEIKHILTQPNQYPFLINSRNEEGHNLSHFYTHSPDMQKFLFEHGMIPEPEPKKDTALQDIIRGNQSVHNTPVVKKTNFITKELVESIKANQYELKQAADSYVAGIPKLLKLYSGDEVRVRLLSLTEDEKRSVMEKTLSGPVPDDKKFIQTVIERSKLALEKLYLSKKTNGEYDGIYPNKSLPYDDIDHTKDITIPKSIGYIKLLIDRLAIPLADKKELLVTLAEQNPQLVQEKLFQIRLELKNDNIFQKEITDRKKFHQLLNDIIDGCKVDKLFKEISDLDIEEIWREQKEIVLIKQIYVAATTYGNNKSTCIRGTWSQIIGSASEINLELTQKYEQHLKGKIKKEIQKAVITNENIMGFEEHLAKKLIQHVEKYSKLKEVLQNFLLHIEPININTPESITFEQQEILAKVNQEFVSNIRKFLPNYERVIPKVDEYKIIIENLSNVSQMQKFALQKSNKSQEAQPQNRSAQKRSKPFTVLEDTECLSVSNQKKR